MLIKDLYKVLSFEQVANQVNAVIFINKDHAIFKGHFPGNPVLPGVCIMQIIKELTEESVGEKLFMAQSNNTKFKAVINPEIHPELKMELIIKEEKEGFKVKNKTTYEDIKENEESQITVALQMSATFRIG